MGVSHPPVSRRSVGNTSKQPYFHLSACRRSSRAGIQSAIQGEWVFTRRIEDCAKPKAPGVSQAAHQPVSGRFADRAAGDLHRPGPTDRLVFHLRHRRRHPPVFTALRIWPGRHFRQTSAGHTALAEILAARLAGWLVFAGAAAGYVYANYYLPVPGDYIYPDSLERTVEAFATQTGSACPLVDDTLRIAGMIEGLSWYSVTTGTSLAAVSRELKWLVWAGFFLNTSVVFIGFIRSLEGALLLACRTERHHPDVGTAGSIHRLAESAKASKAER